MRLTLTGAALAVALAATALVPAGTQAVAATGCPRPPAAPPVKVGQIPGWAESIIVDGRGRMFATELYSGRVFRLDTPGAAAVDLTGAVAASGGIVVRPDGQLLAGTMNSGPLVTDAEILLIDPDTGAASTYADGLGGIDGIALGPDGAVYTTTFAGRYIGRVSPTGDVDPHWAAVPSPNGIAVSPDGTQIYVIQTAPAPALYRIPAGDPAHPQRWITADLLDALAVPDGLTLDSAGVPLVATHVAGQVWRVEGGRFCSVQNGLLGSTQITYGHGTTGFSAGKLYRTGIDGAIYEVPAGFDPQGR